MHAGGLQRTVRDLVGGMLESMVKVEGPRTIEMLAGTERGTWCTLLLKNMLMARWPQIPKFNSTGPLRAVRRNIALVCNTA